MFLFGASNRFWRGGVCGRTWACERRTSCCGYPTDWLEVYIEEEGLCACVTFPLCETFVYGCESERLIEDCCGFCGIAFSEFFSKVGLGKV